MENTFVIPKVYDGAGWEVKGLDSFERGAMLLIHWKRKAAVGMMMKGGFPMNMWRKVC